MPCASAASAALLTALAILGAVYYLPRLLSRGDSGRGGSILEASLFTPEQLRRYDGKASRWVYLAILGEVYDVTPGTRHYGPEGGYARFAGRDASRSYVTGRFSQDAHDDVTDLTAEQMAELVRWRDFYAEHKEYKRVGKVMGRFYNGQGHPTPLLHTVEAAAVAHAQAADTAAGQQAGQSPPPDPCNAKWTKLEGGSVYCSEGRYPRRVMQPDWQGKLQEQCACLDSSKPSGAARLYDGCSPEAVRCATSRTEAAAGAS